MKLKLSLLLIAFAYPFLSQAQTVDEIIAKYFENTGGIEKWKALEGIKINAKIIGGDLEIPLEIIQLKDGRQMTTRFFQGKELKQGVYDGTSLWFTNRINMKAEKNDTETTENFKKMIGEFPDPFLRYKERGLKAELAGKETVDGAETFKIKLTKKPIKVDGKETDNIVFYYFDTENFVPLMIENEIKSGPNKGQIAQNKISDYQEVTSNNPKVSGLLIPFSFSRGMKGQSEFQSTAVSSVELNPQVEPSVFTFPSGN